MSAEKTTIRLSAHMLKRVDSIAQVMGRSRAWVINEAVKRYLNYEEWFTGSAIEGLRQAAAGEVVDHEEVVREWERAAEMDTRRQARSALSRSIYPSGQSSRRHQHRTQDN